MRRSPLTAVEIEMESPGWKKVGRGLPANIEKAVLRTMTREKAKGSLTILLTDDVRQKKLNHLFRGKNRPTNVLSFPTEGSASNYLGDISIALGVVLREAEDSGKRAADHAIHLAVHGVLHLLGHDHENSRDAAVMERREIEILAEFGIANPYAAAGKIGRRESASQHG